MSDEVKKNSGLGLPNWITIIRILLIPFFIAMVLKFRQTSIESYRYYAIGIFILASLTDALDGAIARLKHLKTQIGTVLDPLADKLLLVSAVVLFCVPINGIIQLPIWILVAFISRDLILVFGAILVYLHNQKLTVRPNILGKATTFFQMLTVVWLLFELPSPHVVWRVAGVLTIASGLVYVYQGSRQLGKSQ
jgi:cardiolipin synthase